MRNHIDTSSSFFTTAYFSWKKIWKAKPGRNKLSVGNYIDIRKTGLQFFIDPSAGIEYQHRYNVKKISTKGKIVRFFYGTDIRLAFKFENAKYDSNKVRQPRDNTKGTKRFEITFNYGGRSELSSTLAQKENHTRMIKMEFNYFPFGTENVCFGLSHNDGEDPISAIEKQKFWQFAFKLKLDYTNTKK